MEGLTLTLGSVRGITIRIHLSWLLVFALFTYSLAVDAFPSEYSGWSTAAYWLTGAVASLLLFASVLAHELGHSLEAGRKGIPVRSITLFLFGGVAEISKEAEQAGDEFKIAIAGPAVSVVIGILSLALWALVGSVSDYVAAILIYLGMANLVLVAFNLIPGYPLDGGRVFRALVWRITGKVDRATRIAATVGVGIGMLFMLGGVLLVFSSPISGIWLIAIGWFLQSAAQQESLQTRLQRELSAVPVSAVMDTHPVVVAPDLRLDQAFETAVLGQNARAVEVVEAGRLVGLMTLSDLQGVPVEQWITHTVREAMVPADRLITAAPESPLSVALQAMTEQDIHQIPVVRDGALAGVLTRNGVLQYLQLREELKPEIAARRQAAAPPETPTLAGRDTYRPAEHRP